MMQPEKAVIDDPRPLIRWTAVSGAEHYRIQLRSRVPEGKTLVTLDTVVQGLEFRPPQSLTDYRAQVQVTVRARCDGEYGPASDAAAGRFYIDVSTTCILPPHIDLRKKGTRWHVSWTPVTHADRYQVAVYDGLKGELLAQQEARQHTSALEVAHSQAMVAIRPHCRTGWGEPVYRPLRESPSN